jgi:hypothetical protein
MTYTIAETNGRYRPRALLGVLLAAAIALLWVTGRTDAAGARQDDASPCPVDPSVCAFASRLNQWLLIEDAAAIPAHMRAREAECPGPEPLGLGAPFPLCDGSSPGERLAGYDVGYLHSHGGAFSAEQLQSFLGAWVTSSLNNEFDDYGSGAAQLVSIGCPGLRPHEGASCRDRFTVVFSALQQPPDARMPLRLQLVFHVDQTDGVPRIVHLQSGLVLPPDLATVLQGGRIESAVSPILGAASGTFFVWPR